MTNPRFQVAVMGAGAVGCYFGGLLARAGHDVTLIGRPLHVEAIVRDGLHMDTATFDEHVRVKASSDPAAVEGAQLVLFCVKSGDSERAGHQIAPHVGKDTLVLCLQNGCDNDQRLRAVLAQPEVAAAVVFLGAEMRAPGVVKHHGSGELVIEPSRTIPGLTQMFEAAAIPTRVSDNVRGELWRKLIINCAYNAISALARKPYGQIVPSPGVRDVMRDIVDECLAVATAEGINVPGDVDAAVWRIVETIPQQYSSTAQDIVRGKPTEIDYLNGHVVRRGKALGIRTPANQVLWAMVKLIEAKQLT
ncbi:MAG TPA: 2-dehydropantoate 2-reductase [Vicinamibacterales bacterium]|nr:2-dehydropantoate 2-reductase [Vicinamibacterales bacterium]